MEPPKSPPSGWRIVLYVVIGIVVFVLIGLLALFGLVLVVCSGH